MSTVQALSRPALPLALSADFRLDLLPARRTSSHVNRAAEFRYDALELEFLRARPQFRSGVFDLCA